MHLFDQDTTIHLSDSPVELQTQVSDNWSINGLPNGGYQMALLAGAMLQYSDKKATAIVTASFLSRCTPGQAQIRVEKIAISSQFERLSARLSQGAQEKVRAAATFVAAELPCALNRLEATPPEVAPRSQCLAIPEMPDFTLYHQMDVLFDPSNIGWISGQPSDRSEHKGWIKFKDDRPYDALGVLLVSDSFPPPVFASQGLGAWVPTLEMTVNIRKMPTTRWLKCIFRTQFITCGLLEEDGQVWDESGELVAISRQIAQFRA